MGAPDGVPTPISYLPRTLSDTDLYAKAAVDNSKKALAMITDNSEQFTLADLHPEYKKAGQEASNPTLPQRFRPERMGVGIEFTFEFDEAWTQNYNEQINTLPSLVKEWFLKQQALPFNQRSQLFPILNALIQLGATATTWIDQAARPPLPESATLERAAYNLVVPYMALQGALESGTQILQEATNLLQMAGSSHENFDKILNYTNQLADINERVGTLLANLQQEPPPEGTKQEINQLLTDLNALKAQYANTDIGTDFNILGTTINNLVVVISSVSLGLGPASLYWLTSLATDGIYESESASGVIGEGFHKASDALANGVLALYMPNATTAQQELFTGIATLASLGIMGTTLLLLKEGFTNVPNTTEDVQGKLNTYSVDLLLNVGLTSGTMESLFGLGAKAVGANEKQEENIVNALTLGTLVSLIYAAPRDRSVSETLFNGLHDPLSGLVDKVVASFSEANLKEAAEVHLYLQEMQFALEIKDYEGFLKATDVMLETITIPPGLFLADSQKVLGLVATLLDSFHTGRSEKESAIATMVTTA